MRDLLATWQARSAQQRLAAGGAALAGIVLVLVLAVATLGAGTAPPRELVASTSSATEPQATAVSASATRTARPTSTAAPEQTAGPGAAAIESLRQFVADYGYPEDANFADLRIPVLGVDAKVGSRYVGTDGVMPNPAGPADVAWYDMSAWPDMGGAPGEGGNAIFAGHVDYAATIPYAGVYYRGPGVFSQLKLLSEGDIVEVEYGGRALRYQVVWREQYAVDGTSWGSIWSSDVATDSITLYTCAGSFDRDTLQYSDRIVVRAQRIS